MEETQNRCDDFPFLQGVDLTLWVQVLLSLTVLAVVGVTALSALG